MTGRQLTPADERVAARLRMYREAAGHTQGDLAKAMGVTFQQVQTYERAVNRIAPGRLTQAADFLQLPITAFFDKGSQRRDDTEERLTRLLGIPGAHDLLERFEIMTTIQRALLQRIADALVSTRDEERD